MQQSKKVLRTINKLILNLIRFIFRHWKLVAAGVFLFVLFNILSTNARLNSDLDSKSNQVEILNQQLDKKSGEIESKDNELKDYKKTIDELERDDKEDELEKAEYKRLLQAKRDKQEADRIAEASRVEQERQESEQKKAVVAVASTPTPAPQPSPPPATSVSGTKQQWMAAAGIPQSQWTNVDYIVTRESGWNPSAVNPSSGACGLAQFLPCSTAKAGANWNDPVNALSRQYAYVNARYGGYGGAVSFWQVNHWY